MTAGLTEFLTARYDELEADASPTPWGSPTWRQRADAAELHAGLTLTFACPTCHVAAGETCVAMTPPTHPPKPASSLHGTRQDLARASGRYSRARAYVLADIESKRRILERHNPCDDWSYGDPSSCPELCALALPFADHPDYREEWKP